MVKWKLKLNDMEIEYRVKVFERWLLMRENFVALSKKKDRVIIKTYAWGVEVAEFRFNNKETCDLFYAWLSNKSSEEQATIVKQMIAKYFEEAYVIPFKQKR